MDASNQGDFAFLMLALSLYFIRPLLPELAMQILSLLLGLGFIVLQRIDSLRRRAN